MKIAVIGPGRWGCTLASVLQAAKGEVTLFGLPKDIEGLETNGKIPFTNFPVEEGVKFSTSNDNLSRCEIVFLAVDGQHLEKAWQQWKKHIQGIVAVAVKTIDAMNGKLILPVDRIDHDKVVYFASGAFPEGLLQGSPAVGTIYGPSELAGQVQKVFPTHLLRMYTSNDLIGGQIGSAFKNIIALASGIAMGLGYDAMTRAAIVGRGIHEIERFACRFGAKRESFETGSGVVIDTIGTCFSDSSHNMCAGVAIAKGADVDELESKLGTIEGIRTIRILRMIPGALDEMPIAAAVAKILFDSIAPETAMIELMNRPVST